MSLSLFVDTKSVDGVHRALCSAAIICLGGEREREREREREGGREGREGGSSGMELKEGGRERGREGGRKGREEGSWTFLTPIHVHVKYMK